MKEDPLERLDRLEAEKNARRKSAGKGLVVTIVVLSIIALALAGVLAYKCVASDKLEAALTEEKDELAREFQALQYEFGMMADSLDAQGSRNEMLMSQLDSSQAEVAVLYEKLQKTQATDRAEIRKYQKELGTLRAIMRDYVKQIDSLNTLNKKLTADNAALRKDAAESRKAYQNLSAQTTELQNKVNIGSAIKLNGPIVLAGKKMNANRSLERHQNVERLVAEFTLAANDLTPKGPLTIYAVVKDEQGVILVNSESVAFTCNGESMTASASRTVDYTGGELPMSLFVNNISVEKGTYTFELYSDKGLCGSTEIYFR